MSKFNTRSTVVRKPDTVNLSGAPAYKQEAKLELASLICTSFVTDQYYRGSNDTLDRMRELVKQVDPLFAAKAAVYARNTDGMRSITHAVAGEVAANVKGEQWTKRFFDKVVRRPDDTTEILAYYLNEYGKPLPNSLKKGLGTALGKFDTYQLAKYRGDKKAISLVDVVNLCHPVPTNKNREALAALVNDTLRSTGTWEAKLTQAGKSENVEAAKQEAWGELLSNRKIGYLALLRNLRNIVTQAPDLEDLAIELLTDAEFVERSLVFPFQYISAYRELQDNPKLLRAISDAIDLSLVNVPDLGKTLVAVDSSGSMTWGTAAGSQISNFEVGALFAAAYFKKDLSHIVKFDHAKHDIKGLNPGDSTMSIFNQIVRSGANGGSTDFRLIFSTNTKYDSIVVFSDMQANIGTGHSGLAEYKKRTGANPNIFAFDLGGHGSSQFDPRKKVYQIAGYSDKTFGLLGTLSKDPNAFVAEIEKVVI